MGVRNVMNKSLLLNEEEFLKQFDGPTSMSEISGQVVGRIKVLDKLYQYDYISKDIVIKIIRFMFKNIKDIKTCEFSDIDLDRFVKLYNNLCNGIIDQGEFCEAMVNKYFINQDEE